MSEHNSTQMANIAATPPVRLDPTERHGRVRVMFGQAVLAAAGAIADTIYFGRVPVGARFVDVRLSNSAGTASSTLALGLRKTSTGEVIDADGLTAAASIAAAQNVSTPTGALIAAGATYVTEDEVDVYGTIAGAGAPAGQTISVTALYVVD